MYSSIYPQPTIISGSNGKNDIKFPQDIQVILRSDRPQYANLYIGNIEAAENKMIIENLQIGAILCVAKSYSTKHSKDFVKFTKYVPVEESENAQIGQYLDECVDFINDKLKITNVLIHCVAGTNRSACFAIAFLIKFRNLSLEDAYNQVKSRRKIICPNDNMISQLKKYEKGLISKIKNNSTLIPEIRLNEPSTIYDGGEKSIRIKTNMFDRSNFLQVEDRKSVNNSKMTNKVRLEVLDQIRSHKTNKSCHSKILNNNKTINISINQPKTMKNPQQSLISKRSKVSALNKSFYSPSQLNQSEVIQFDHLPTQINLTKKSSSSREQYMQKVKYIDSKNNQINNKISYIHSKFQNQHTNHKLNLEAELNQINQLRFTINMQKSERKSKFAQRRELHDKTMENKQVQEYIATLPLSTAKK